MEGIPHQVMYRMCFTAGRDRPLTLRRRCTSVHRTNSIVRTDYREGLNTISLVPMLHLVLGITDQ